jgi:hypothetical protein
MCLGTKRYQGFKDDLFKSLTVFVLVFSLLVIFDFLLSTRMDIPAHKSHSKYVNVKNSIKNTKKAAIIKSIAIKGSIIVHPFLNIHYPLS